jgi:hypothetical protein
VADRLPIIEVRLDPVAIRGDMVTALAGLLLARARKVAGERAARPPADRIEDKEETPREATRGAVC